MSIRSLLTTGLLAASVLASPPGYGASTKTVTVTETKKVVHDHTKTITKTKTVEHDHTKTVTSTKTKTATSSITATITKSASCSASSSTSGSTSHSTTSSASSSSSSVTTTTSSSTNTNPTTTLTATATATGYGLNDAAKQAGKLWFGTAFDYPGTGEAEDPYYAKQFNNTHDFGEATPANIMKFEFTEPEQNVFNFTGGDEFIAYTKPTKEYIRCHNLIWQSELSDWVTNPTVNWTNATLTAALRNHVTKVIEHFGDECYSWDVVNEALSDSPAGAYQQNIWYNTIGPAYVVEAFDAATQAVKANNLNVKLYYNDYNIEYPGNKSIGAQNIVKDLKARGIQIDGVGFESHFIIGETPSQASLQSNIEAFAALGVDVAITELDVRGNVPLSDADQIQQVKDYYSVTAACVAEKTCIGITLWDFDDTYSWIPGTFPGQGAGDVWFQPNGAGTPLVKKAIYDGILDALTGAPEGLKH